MAANLRILAIFSKKIFFPENLSSFHRKNQFLKSLRKFVISVAFCCKFANFGDFRRSEIFSKISYFLRKKTIFCTLWVILPSQSVPMETFLSLIFSCYIITNYSVSKSPFFSKQSQTFNTLRNFLISVAFCSKFAIFMDVWKKQGFVLKNASKSRKKTKTWTILEFLLTQWLSMANFLWISAVLKKNSKICFNKPFFKTKVKEVLRKFILSVAFRCKIMTFSDF